MINMLNAVNTFGVNMMSMLAPVSDDFNFGVFQTVKIILFSLMVICSLFLIFVILMQPGNSSGSSAITGETETYLGKNKGKSKEGIFKILTIISAIGLVVFSITFFVFQMLA